MRRERRWPYFLKDFRAETFLVLLVGTIAGLLSGCSSTGGHGSMPDEPPDVASIPDAVPKAEPKSKYGNPASYVVFGKRYYTKASSKNHVERGLASWYGKKFHGRRTSSGERYDMYAMTAAHKTLPLPTYARVTNVSNGRSAVVKINDRGPFHGNRVIDLSYTAARKLGVVAKGTAMVEIEAIDPSRPRSGREDYFLASNDDSVAAAPRTQEKAVAARKASPSAPAQKAAPRVAKAEPAQPPAPTAQARVQTASAARAAPSNTAPRVALASPGARPTKAVSPTYLQVGAFGSRLNAEQLRRQLSNHMAVQVKVLSTDGMETPLYKVHVGPFDSREHARELSQQLASLGLTGSHIVVQ